MAKNYISDDVQKMSCLLEYDLLTIS